MTTLILPRVLAFDRKLEPSDALLKSGHWENLLDDKLWQPIKLFPRRNLAVKSNFKPEVLADEEELQKQIKQPNLAWGDDAKLDDPDDTLKISFSLRVVSGLGKPSACNKPEFEDALREKVGNYAKLNLDALANRYAYNIANGRFLWRNRVGAQSIMVVVTHPNLREPLKFNSYDFKLKKTTSDDVSVKKLATIIKEGLVGDHNIALTINAFVRLGTGQRVWPSQEMVLDLSPGEKSKYLFSLNGVAAIHCEKIGNALRTIDDWYPKYAETNLPIAIEAYGSVTQKGEAFRAARNDFKTLLLKWLNDETLSEDDKLFVVAMVIRGGVFGEREDEG